MPIADKNYYVDVNNNIVEEGNVNAHKLLVAKGGRIDQKVADRHGLTGLIPDEEAQEHTLSAKIRRQTEADYEAMERDGILPPGTRRGGISHGVAPEANQATAEAMSRQSDIYSRPNPAAQKAAREVEVDALGEEQSPSPQNALEAGVGPFGGHVDAHEKNFSLVDKGETSSSSPSESEKERASSGEVEKDNAGGEADPVTDALVHPPPVDQGTGKPTDQTDQPVDKIE
ncbi:MAG: hypothetical protein DMF68_13630 [Acidobacteria bacterium]|nr:MAG: hypothetical protein DMF68_13630 [Acidobacteriota bacterium]